MAEGGEAGKLPPGLRPFARAVVAIGVSAVLKVTEKRGLDSPKPSVMWRTKRSDELRNLASRLAENGHEDIRAIDELTQAADGKTDELRRAAAGIRFLSHIDEDRVGNRANRLLLAAAAGREIEPLTAQDEERFRQVDALKDGAVDASFAKLASLAPGLIDLERKVRKETAHRDFTSMALEQREKAFMELIYEPSHELVGLEASSVEFLVRTNLAWYIARDHLRQVSGLPDLG